jgi:hypothetical protein
MNENKQTSWEDKFIEVYCHRYAKYELSNGNFRELVWKSEDTPDKVIEFISQLLKEQRENVVDNILIGFGVGTIEDYQISIITNNGLKAPEPTLEGEVK